MIQINLYRYQVSRILASIAVFFAAMVLIGWWQEIEDFQTGYVGTVTMKVNTALGLFLLGTTLLVSWKSVSKLRLALLGFFMGSTFLLGCAVLSQYIFGIDLGIDQLLFVDTHTQTG